MSRSQRSPTERPLNRILVIRNDRIGDLLLTLPAIGSLREAFPHARISLLASDYTAPLVSQAGLIDECLIDDTRRSAASLSRCIAAGRFDAVLVLTPNTRNVVAAWLARVPVRVCWACKPAGMLLATHRVCVSRSHPPIHETRFAWEFVRALAPWAPEPRTVPRLAADAETARRIAHRVSARLGDAGPLFAVHPGNRHSAYNWPASHYGLLVRRLASHGRVVVTGTPTERPLIERVLAAGDSPRAAPLWDMSLAELTALLRAVDVLTVSSTGPLHLAGVLGTPAVALFSAHPAQSPRKWRPLGGPCTILQARLAPGESPGVPPRRSESHMATIAIPDVLAANLRYLSLPGRRCSTALVCNGL